MRATPLRFEHQREAFFTSSGYMGAWEQGDTPQSSSQILDACGLPGAGGVEPGLESWPHFGLQSPYESIPSAKNGNEQRCGDRMIQLLGLPDSGLRRPRTHRQLSPRRCRLGVSRDRTPVGGEIEAESHFAVPLPRLGAAAPPGTRAGSSQGRPRQDVPTQGLALGKAVGRARGRAPRALVPLRPILSYSLCRPKSPSALSREVSEWVGGRAWLPER